MYTYVHTYKQLHTDNIIGGEIKCGASQEDSLSENIKAEVKVRVRIHIE